MKDWARARNGDDPEQSETPTRLRLVDWSVAFNRPPVDATVDGLVFPGRWTATIAPPKVGKSTLRLHIAQTLTRGLDPFTATPQPAVSALYLDGEMRRFGNERGCGGPWHGTGALRT
jgi:hypothetical protein